MLDLADKASLCQSRPGLAGRHKPLIAMTTTTVARELLYSNVARNGTADRSIPGGSNADEATYRTGWKAHGVLAYDSSRVTGYRSSCNAEIRCTRICGLCRMPGNAPNRIKHLRSRLVREDASIEPSEGR